MIYSNGTDTLFGIFPIHFHGFKKKYFDTMVIRLIENKKIIENKNLTCE